MSLELFIPDSVAQAIRYPEEQLQEGLLLELALTLYAQGALSFGKARELAGLSKYDFALRLGRRGIVRHYGPEELADDLHYASS
jgi:predicted HTH domain antitoxin